MFNKIDAHQHFWKFDPVKDAWISDDMQVIQRDFLPQDLEPLLQQNGFDGCVAVQADQSEEETSFLLQLADTSPFIKGIVGWVDLQSDSVEERLQHFSRFEKLKGFRHILQGEPKRDLMLSPAFKKGISLLHRFDFTYDILIYRDQLPYVLELVATFPEQKFVIDHLAKPEIKTKQIMEWRKGITSLAGYENLYCKLSGLVTEADWRRWQKSDFKPYLDTIVETFGTSRLLYGSDWPVCLLAGSYAEVLSIVEDYFAAFSADEKRKIFAENAVRFYRLD